MTTPTSRTTQLLEHYLPHKNGRTPAERIRALAGKALQDGSTRIEARLHRPLLPEERVDAHSTLVLSGLKSANTYNPNLDQGTGTLPTDILFGRFAYLRMRTALIDWERKTFGDRRPGRTPHPNFVSILGTQSGELIDAYDQPDHLNLEDLTANRDQTQRWQAAALNAGLTLAAWITTTLDAASGDRRAA